MKVMWRMLIILLIFFAATVPFYAGWQQKDFGSVPELAGPIALLMTALMMALAGWYLWVTNKKFDKSPEDNPEGLISDAEGDYGFFTPYSWWPLWLGLSAAGLFAGLAVGWWLFMIFAVTGAISLVGWTFEAYKGEHAN
jgi:hypothetical protein